jgi:hypothetical protein
MRGRKGRLAKLLSVPVLAVCGFAVAATLAGVGLATVTTTSTSTPTTTTTPPPTSTTTTTTTTTTPPGQEGCTPGFWKNHPEAWVGYLPSQTFASVFGVAVPGQPAELTLGAALELGGGGANALARQAVAALLNAAHPEVDYPLSEAQIIAMVNAAITSGNAATIESLKDTLDEANNLTAPGFCD